MKTAERRPARGLCCPKCEGKKLMVYRTHRPCAGRVVRYRKCESCGHRVTTAETVVSATSQVRV